MKVIEKSDAFVINGAGMEEFLDNVLVECENLNIIDSSEGTHLIAECHHHDHDKHSGHDCEEDEMNPHIWLSVNNYIKQVENICEGLIKLNPQNAEIYRTNTQIYKLKLLSLKAGMQRNFVKVSNRKIITFHEAFPYFAEEFGLDIVASINREPNSQPSAKELVKTIKKIKKTGVKVLFAEPQYPKTSASIISNETGAIIYELDPIVSGELNKNAYIDTMNKNLGVLLEALS